MHIHEIRTSRLLLRNWKESDYEPFIGMGQNERVMKYFPKLMTPEQSREYINAQMRILVEKGWGMYAVEELHASTFIGFIGIRSVPYELPFSSLESPMIEIGWRLRPEWWNQGLATEGALGCLQLGFETLGLKEIISFTTVINTPSIRVMQKIGMRRDHDADFDHPKVEEGHPVRPHLVYRMTKEDWENHVISNGVSLD